MKQTDLSLIPIRYYDFGPEWRPGAHSIYLQSQLHGNETFGTVVLLKLVRALSTLPDSSILCPIRIVPHVNPFSWEYYLYARQGTFEPSSGKNWNRIFDWDEFGYAITEVPSKGCWQFIREEAARRASSATDATRRLSLTLLAISAGFQAIVDVHTPEFGIAHLYCSHFSESIPTFGIRHIVESGQPTTDTFYEAHLRLARQAPEVLGGAISITIELPNHAPVTGELVREWLDRFLFQLSALAIIDASQLKLCRTDQTEFNVGSLVDYCSLTAGIQVHHFELGESVRKGDELFSILPFDPDRQLETVLARADCTPLCLRRDTAVQPGTWVVRVLEQERKERPGRQNGGPA